MYSSLKNDLSLRYIVIAAAMVMFAINLDFFAVLTVLLVAALQFSVTMTDLQWIISGYMLVLTPCLVVGGRLADLLGRRTWPLIGATVFGLASLSGSAAARQAK